MIIEGHESSATKITSESGVPQGSVLAPLLFLYFIKFNDLPENIKIKIQLYADDVLLYSNISSLDDCYQLQADSRALGQQMENGI